MVDLSVHDMHLAGRTQAVAARMREIDAGAECGIEEGLSFLDGHARPQWLDGEFVCHSCQGFGNSAQGNGVQHGSASCGEKECQYVEDTVAPVYFKKK